MLCFTSNIPLVPSAPVVNLSYVNESSTSILVSWSPPLSPNGIITNYTVIVTRVQTGMNLTLSTNDTELLIIDLEAHTDYLVIVFAETDAGVGEPSHSLAVLTEEDGTFIKSILSAPSFYLNIKHEYQV